MLPKSSQGSLPYGKSKVLPFPPKSKKVCGSFINMVTPILEVTKSIDNAYVCYGFLLAMAYLIGHLSATKNVDHHCKRDGTGEELGRSLGVGTVAEDIKTKIKNYKSAPFDSSFPNQNQIRNCWQNYQDFHHCKKAMTAKGGAYAATVSFHPGMPSQLTLPLSLKMKGNEGIVDLGERKSGTGKREKRASETLTLTWFTYTGDPDSLGTSGARELMEVTEDVDPGESVISWARVKRLPVLLGVCFKIRERAST
ncbi:hypothetical protein U0070_001823 [Myodes glareolus]|uniref:Uncharacterized protein n=1 Tax=Myodes glareolus TaxID=447135 RepID=A0AAW0ISH6_MYOGA